jgi:tetratricopeptide (TPR) repeat protein
VGKHDPDPAAFPHIRSTRKDACMRRPSPFALAGVLLLVLAGPATTQPQAKPRTAVANAPGEENADERIKHSLLVQSAMQQGRECLNRGEYQIAVRVLEGHLPKINGNSLYLALLEEAYRDYIRELKQKGQEELAQKYLDRLAILDPGVLLPAAVKPAAPGANAKPPGMIVRGRSEEDKAEAGQFARLAQDAVAAGDKEFLAHRYREAGTHYQKAAEYDRNQSAATRERWAYCKLFVVTEQINHPPAEGLDWAALEQEVRVALTLAPRMEYGHTVLRIINERSQAPAKKTSALQYRSQRPDEWLVMDSANFRVHYNDAALADQVLQVAEHTRRAVALKWLGEGNLPVWTPKCDIYLYPNVEVYSRATGVGTESPGHSSIGAVPGDASRVLSRVIHLHVDDPSLLAAVLPHETTHVTLAGQYGAKPIPRWADEGMAILSEPADRVQRHLNSAPNILQEARSFSAAELLQLEEYPGPGMMTAFYGQSVAVVSYLSDLRGPQAFTSFLRTAARESYEAALRKHYSLNGFADLDSRWRQNAIKADQLAAQR